MKTKNPKFNWHQHGLLLFVAVTFGVSLSYVGINYFDHQTRAAALPLLQYLSPDRGEVGTEPKYPICPHLVDATITVAGQQLNVFQDLCTDLYWAKDDTVVAGASYVGSDWHHAAAKRLDGSSVFCPTNFELPTSDQLLTLAYIPCGEIKYCENSANAPIFCSEDNNCPQVRGTATKPKVCSEASTIACANDVDCVKQGAGVCVDLGYCENNPTRSCATTVSTSCDTKNAAGVTVSKGDGNCEPKHYSCIADSCSPIARRFGSYQGTSLNKTTQGTHPNVPNVTTSKTKINADASYWTRQEVDGLQGKQCSNGPSVSCTTDANCRGTCQNVGSTLDQTGGSALRTVNGVLGSYLDAGQCSNAKDVKCFASTDCNIGACELNESAVSVNLKYGTVNNPVMGKNTILNVRCIYNSPTCTGGQILSNGVCITPATATP